MTTLMSWGNTNGTKGRCDARCHNARGKDCRCMCAGRYHGKGSGTQAIRDAQEGFLEELLAKPEGDPWRKAMLAAHARSGEFEIAHPELFEEVRR